MPSNWTFGRKLGLAFGIAALTLLAIGYSGYRSTHRLIENEAWVAHTHEVRSELARLMALMVDAETGQRGYLITGNEAFLQPYRDALAQLDATYDGLRRLVTDNPEQQRRLEGVRKVMDEKLGELKSTAELRRTSGLEAAARPVAAGEGKRAMDELRRLLAEMDRAESDLLERRRVEAEESADRAKAIILWGSLLGVVLVGVVGSFTSRSLGSQISAAVRHIQSSSAELQSASNQQATGAREQATAMNEIATTISELLATSRQIAESAQRVALVAERTAQAARAGDSTVVRGSDTIAGIRKQVDLIVSHMLELGKKSQQIGAVLDIVAELAEQTNILAINATIEAAGAGDSGKRFAVVADEIRKLADRVGGSTKEIRALIDDVRAAVNLTVMTTETGSKAVDGGAKQFAEVATSFNAIASQVATTTEAAREIELSTKQQSSAVEQVNIAITNVAQAAKESEVSTRQTLQTASELAGLSRDLIRIVQPQEASMAHATP